MMKRKAGVFASLLVTAVLAMPVQAAKAVSGAAEDFTLKTTTGSNLRLSEQKGTVIMLNFWASWCGPCRQEMPLLNELNKKYGKYGFSVWGVNVDDDPAAPLKVLKEIPVDFPVLLDTKNSIPELYKVEAMPSTVFIDRNGNKRYIHEGYKAGEEAEYEKIIKQLIRE